MILQRAARKRIGKDDLRLGMYISGFEGNWLDHPFWKSRFLLDKHADLEAIRSSAIAAVIIDTSKGLDVLVPEIEPVPAPRDGTSCPPATLAPDPASALEPEPQPAPKVDPSPPALAHVDTSVPRFSEEAGGTAPASLADEMARAGEIVHHARRIVTELFDEVRLGKVVEASNLQPLVDEIAASIARNRSAMSSIVRLKSKDEYTYMHSVAVSTLMINLADELGLSQDEKREAGLAGLLHDIGKMAVPNDLLQKAGALSDKEFRLIRTHPARGHALLLQSEGVPEAALDVCLHHHEKMDGTGYPHRLPAEKISLFARMGAICDVYDAVTSHRPYKEPWTPFEALARMKAWTDHFDPAILASFIRCIGIYPVGTLVRLKSGRLALVKAQTGIPTQPLVRVFRSIPGRIKIDPYDLDLSNIVSKHAFAGTEDAIIAPERPEDWEFDDWVRSWPMILGEPSPAGGA
ncbi:HD-GYP domain-containing protein (plasmid) [Sphingobium xenophagum]|nr:HD-GYP domain-containing protein [Sphingobium xenophagum]